MPQDAETARPTMDQAFDVAVAEATKSAEDTSGDTAEEETEQPEGEKGQEAAPSPDTSEAEEILEKAEYERLKDNPAALRKALNRAFTQKTQKLADERRSIAAHRELIEAFERDPDGTLTAIAKQRGFEIAKPKAAVEKAAEAAASIAESLKAQLGPDLEFLAPALEQAARMAAEQVVKTQVEPLRLQAEQLSEHQVAASVRAELEAFSAKHPEWKTHEPKMLEFAAMLEPREGMSQGQYLETLLTLATAGQAKAAMVKETVKAMKKAAEKAEPAEAGVSQDKVAKGPPKRPTMDEAFEAAKQGIRWD